MDENAIPKLILSSLLAGLLLVTGARATNFNAPAHELWGAEAGIGILHPAVGCTAYPVAISGAERSVTPPGQGSNPYPAAAEFEYPPVPPAYDSFLNHHPDVPLANATAGTLYRLLRGFGVNGFNWLVWNEGIEASATTLAHSLTWPGDSDDYADRGDPGTPLGSLNYVVRGFFEPGDPADTNMGVGDWVAATGDVFDATPVRDAVNSHIDTGRILRLPVWLQSDAGAGPNGRYQISGFAIFRFVGYSMEGEWVLLEFVAWDNACEVQMVWKQHLPVIQKLALPPHILSFTANVEIADPGDTIELAWETENATDVTLYHLLPTGQFGTFWQVAASGSMTYTISDYRRNQDWFALFADNASHPAVSASLTIPLRCPYDWFFAPAPDICAQDEASVSLGVEQHFEHGLMLWLGGEDRIYVLYDEDQYTTRWQAFTDEWEEGDPIDDPSITPPSGFYQPQRGFGLVWREQPLVRERLGWAVALEEGYETALQHTSYARYNDTFIRAVDGNVWRLLPEGSGWEKVITTR